MNGMLYIDRNKTKYFFVFLNKFLSIYYKNIIFFFYSFIYKIFFKINYSYNIIFNKLNIFFVNKLNCINVYYIRNENIWIDGFLFDFLQKKTADYFLRRFVVNTGILFIEFFLFDIFIKIYYITFIHPMHSKNMIESLSVSEMLSITIFIYYHFLIFVFVHNVSNNIFQLINI